MHASYDAQPQHAGTLWRQALLGRGRKGMHTICLLASEMINRAAAVLIIG